MPSLLKIISIRMDSKTYILAPKNMNLMFVDLVINLIVYLFSVMIDNTYMLRLKL